MATGDLPCLFGLDRSLSSQQINTPLQLVVDNFYGGIITYGLLLAYTLGYILYIYMCVCVRVRVCINPSPIRSFMYMFMSSCIYCMWHIHPGAVTTALEAVHVLESYVLVATAPQSCHLWIGRAASSMCASARKYASGVAGSICVCARKDVSSVASSMCVSATER